MSQSILIGYFDNEEKVVEATRAARQQGYTVHDVYTPYAVHALDEALGLKPSRLTWVCFLAGLTGGSLALAFEIYVSAVSWPLNVGGKPMLSIPAFIPVAFELTVLCAALVTVAAFFARSRLFPGQKAAVLPRVTDDRFALVLKAGETSPALESWLQGQGAVETAKAEVTP